MTQRMRPHAMYYATQRAMTAVLAVGMVCSMGCHTSDVLPPGTRDPGTYNTPTGAVQVAHGAVGLFRSGLSLMVTFGGQLTDELNVSPVDKANRFNLRSLDIIDNSGYATLQTLRSQASIARGTLVKYAPNASPVLRAEMYALEGYADIYLADHYCSGVPLSTVNFEQQQSFTYRPGSTTLAVYEVAAALLDSAITLSHDSLRIETLARVGLGRALLALGRRDSAAHVVATVPDTATYSLRTLLNMWDATALVVPVYMGDREGGDGLPFASANDPRVPTTTESFATSYGTFTLPIFTAYLPALNRDSVSVIVASGVEARLIEAEAQLARGGVTWLHTLNRLRTDSTFTTAVRRDPVTSDSIGVDTTWNAGTGRVAGLPPLTDPGSDAARLALVFQERGYWLYLSAHRQGDFRRLVRQTSRGGYGLAQSRVYPVGLAPTGEPYGSAVNFPISDAESRNPLYKGCLNRDA